MIDDKTGDNGILLEDATGRNNGTHLLVQESGQTLGSATDGPNISGGRLIIEHEHVDGGILQRRFWFLLINRYRENESAGSAYVVMEEGNTGDEGNKLSTEDLGTRLVLEDGDRILFEEDIQFDNIVLNGTDSSSVDDADDIIHESGIDFSNDNVTITDSSGAAVNNCICRYFYRNIISRYTKNKCWYL